ncbi:MAG TPA: NUDIX hydrolase [Nocardioidaceae bacterium]|nr:NUDIX hydrolase [Nocardioidaceae bacterium]
MTDPVDPHQALSDGELSLRRTPASDGVLAFAVFHRRHVVGEMAVRDLGDGVGDLRWEIEPSHRRRGYATRALRLLVAYAFAELDYLRLEARVPRADVASTRIAGRSGLRREGVQRHRDSEVLLLGRLRDDPEPEASVGFRALLNSTLPRKRAIAQLAVRDQHGRLLLCNLTYKQDWDLPGGVVEDDESPHAAAERECLEELNLDLRAGRLLLVDWLPAWGGWDDACVFVFDGGVHDASITDAIVPQPREIRRAEFCDETQIADRCADFTARRAGNIIHGDPGELRYLESGR